MDHTEFSSKSAVIVSVIVIIAIVGGVALLLSTRPDPVQITINPPIPTATPEPSATPGPIRVYVTGAVANPHATVQLPPGSRVQDALDAAGGVTENADLDRVNPVGILHDGDQVHVFTLGEGAVSDEATLPTPSGSPIVYVNTATLEELVTLPGIGPVTAQRIIDYREEHGPFADLESLDEVDGIGPATLENIRDFVSFE